MREFNFDGLVGPTHNYAGLSYGNVASALHQNAPSNPRQAALQGLAKMRLVASLGISQAVIPPLVRPNLRALHQLGFRGSPAMKVESAWQADPVLLAAIYSASSMWTANAATVSPSSDCRDGKLHVSPANLTSMLHRALETRQMARVLRVIFADPQFFLVHDPLPAAWPMADEGAANHTRLAPAGNGPGLELFAFGRVGLNSAPHGPQRFPARQTLEACQALARRHQLHATRTFFWQQSPSAIDAGVFHNDVIAVGNEDLLLVHEQAYVDQPDQLRRLVQSFRQEYSSELQVIEISAKQLPLADAVASYFFNSQLLTRPDGRMTLLCPADCETNPKAAACLADLRSRTTRIDDVRTVDLRQSMNNGGGPACLRLRVRLTDRQAAALPPGVLWSTELDQLLTTWVERHYRDCLRPDDLRDPKLLVEARTAQEHLAEILKLPADVLLDD